MKKINPFTDPLLECYITTLEPIFKKHGFNDIEIFNITELTDDPGNENLYLIKLPDAWEKNNDWETITLVEAIRKEINNELMENENGDYGYQLESGFTLNAALCYNLTILK